VSLFDAFCIADADLALMLMRLHANGDALPPNLARFAEAQWSRPSVKKWVARARPPFVPSR
jgi:glutathione S-transferase